MRPIPFPSLDKTEPTDISQRRRTQIRLAQRAYRSRKENAIQSLEQRVQELQQTNEEMSNAFMQLHDFAMGRGVLERVPEFANELRATTEKFLALARRSSEEPDEGGHGERNISSAGKEPEDSADHEKKEDACVGALDPAIWGYTVTSEAEMAPVVDLTAMPPTPTTLSYETMQIHTPDVNPFPFGLTPTTDDDLTLPTTFPDFFSTIPAANTPPQSTTTPQFSPPHSPFESLPLPRDLSYTESTFGRRLQRTALQWGYQLITMSNPPPQTLARVFGFCLLFEPADKIRERMRAGLAKLADENLHFWQWPFWALGGAGKHQFGGPTAGSEAVVGNEGKRNVAKHGFGGDFGMGPFGADVMEARARRLDSSMRITLPGWSGEFYDPDDVEAYLRSKGVVIRPGQDFVTAEVESGWFEEGEGSVGSPDTSASSGSFGTGSRDGWGVGGDGGVFGGGFGSTTASGFDFGGEASWAAFTGSESAPRNQKKIVTLDVDILIRGEFRSLCASFLFSVTKG